MTEPCDDPLATARTVYISVGNSDGKLTEQEWQQFRDLTHELLTDVLPETGGVVHGAWRSWQAGYVNACWCVEVPAEHEDIVKDTLRTLAEKFRQDSIAYAVAETEFLRPGGAA